MTRPPRRVSADAAALFRAAVADATPLVAQRVRRVVHDLPRPPAHPRQRSLDEAQALIESIAQSASCDLRLESGDEAAFRRPGVPRSVLRDLRRGRWVVQNRLDLHGATRDEAHALMSAFVAHGVRHGMRCVRIIHGKGLRSPGGEPVLKAMVQGWLARSDAVLAFCQARAAQGGSGALVVLLRAGAPGARSQPR